MGVSQIKGTILGVPTIRIIVFRGLHWGPASYGNYHISFEVYSKLGTHFTIIIQQIWDHNTDYHLDVYIHSFYMGGLDGQFVAAGHALCGVFVEYCPPQ